MMLFVVNFKAYRSSVGVNAVRLAKVCERVSKEQNVGIAVAVQPTDILAVASSVRIPVLAQHVDSVDFGAHTGWILPEAVCDAGACGSLVNHSEHRLGLSKIKELVGRLRKLGLLSIVCAPTPARAAEIATLKPDVLAIEPPALIGTKTSVSKANPKVISDTVKAAKGIPVLCGAGINTRDDVIIAERLGAQGILVSSVVAKAKDPRTVLMSLVRSSRNP